MCIRREELTTKEGMRALLCVKFLPKNCDHLLHVRFHKLVHRYDSVTKYHSNFLSLLSVLGYLRQMIL